MSKEHAGDLLLILGGIWLTLIWKPLGVMYLIIIVFGGAKWTGFGK